MIAGTDFGLHRRGSFLGDRQVNFPNDSAHKTIADRLMAAGLDFKQYAEELPAGTCPWNISGQHLADKRGDYTRRHVPFLSFREVQEKWCDHVIVVDSAKADNFCSGHKKVWSPIPSTLEHESRWARYDCASGGRVGKEVPHETFPDKLKALVIVTFTRSGRNGDSRVLRSISRGYGKAREPAGSAVLGKRYRTSVFCAR
jgi:hypothetical protein